MKDAVSSPESALWPRDPYKGLNRFCTADAPLFSQRDREIDEVTALLSNFDTRVLLFHGGTGTGKSSFLRAGLGPRLQGASAEDSRKFFFLRESGPDDFDGDPLLIRATNDPIARVFEALRTAVATESSGLSTSVRQAIRDQLPESPARDRREAIPSILLALKHITAPPQRNTFVLVIDQAEEVLTLPKTADAKNVRRAFFEFLEQICFRSLDLRVIVALRTEYYGRFCSFFLIRPTNSLTPATEARAGLMDYLLRPLGERQVAAAIRQPTLDEANLRDDGLPPPRSVYKFSFEEPLPELIASDLVRHSGEASVLPTMQIVCKHLYESVVLKGKRTEITKQDYLEFGRAEGAINSFMIKAIRDAAAAAHLPESSDTEVDSWALILSRVVGRTAGGTVQTLVATEQDLVTEAVKHKIGIAAARAMLREMLRPDRRLLRRVGGEGGTSAYSLGHDSLGPSVLRRSAQAAVRAEAEAQLAKERAARALTEAQAEAQLAQEREKRAVAELAAEQQRVQSERLILEERYKTRLIVGIAAFVVFALCAAGVLYVSIFVNPVRERIKAVTQFAEQDQTADLRQRLLLLATAVRSGDHWPLSWFIDTNTPKQVIRNVLFRSPVFGGNFTAGAFAADGRRIIRLENDKLIVHDLTAGKDIKSYDLPIDSDERVASSSSPSVGLITREDGSEGVIGFRSASATVWIEQEDSTLKKGFMLPEKFQEPGEWNARAELFGNHARVIILRFDRSAIREMSVLDLSGAVVSNHKPEELLKQKLDWQPLSQQAFRQPILAEDCDRYAFLGQNDQGEADKTLWTGQVGQKAIPASRFGKPTSGFSTRSVGTVAIARGCKAALARDESTLHVVPLVQDEPFSKQRSITLNNLKREEAAMVVPSSAQVQPMFAAAPRKDSWRIAWLTAGGLAVLDLSSDEDAPKGLSFGGQLLTGTDPIYVLGSLSLSPDGKYALLMQQPTFGGSVQLRAFNLDLTDRRDALQNLTTDDLIKEACRVALIQDGSNRLRSAEQKAWFGTEDVKQPCTPRAVH